MRRLWVSRMDKLGNSTERCWGSARSALFQVAQVRFRDSLTHLPGVLGHSLGHSLRHKEIQTLKWLTWSPTNRYGSSSLLYCSECMAKLYPVADTRVHHRQEAVLNLTASKATRAARCAVIPGGGGLRDLITATGGQDLWSSASPRQTAASRLQGRAGPPYIYVGLHHSHLFPPYSPLRRDAPPKDNQLTYQCRSICGRQESSTTRTRSSSMKVDASEPHLDYGTGCSINIRTVRSQVQDRPATPVPGPYLDSGYHCL